MVEVAEEEHHLAAKYENDEEEFLFRYNIFHTRGIVKEKVCSFIIDGGNSENIMTR